MSIAGVYARRGPVPLDRLDRIASHLRHLAPDGERVAQSDPVAVLHGAFHTTARERRIRQPHVTADGLLLAFDGWLDAGADLRRELDVGEQAESTTVDLVAAAYRRWDIDGFARLSGDFALSLWDPAAQRLVLCRDPLGHRPLYYHVSPDIVAWASRCRALVDGLELPFALDADFVAGFLLNWPTARSAFRDVLPVLPGHVVIVERGRLEQRQYWAIDPARRLNYRTDSEYAEHLAALLREVIASHAESDRPVFSELSGGLDSSTIACIAEELRASGAIDTPEIRTVSHVFDRASTSDERKYIRLVEERIGHAGLHLSEEECPILAPLPASLYADLPTGQLLFLSQQDRVTREMQRVGARVLLNGIGGDQLFWSQPPPAMPLADLVAQHRYATLLRSCGEWSRSLRWPLLRTLWHGAIWPTLPHRWRARTQREEKISEWLNPHFVRRLDLRGRLEAPDEDGGFTLPSSVVQSSLVRRGLRSYALVYTSSAGHVEARHPYLDRRLVEFALAVPVERSVRPGQTRIVFRNATTGVLPEPIRLRRSKGGPSEAIYRALVRQWHWLAPLLRDPLVAQYGFVDRDAFSTAVTRARHGLTTHEGQLTATLALELWLRSLDRPKATQEERTESKPRARQREATRDAAPVPAME
jgi:asparagine synthase (glutamine-hydrolysing)